jgi:hypothetical protein
MDLQATAQLLGNFGEFFGAIAVVVTLIYLAGQLRQNTNSLKLNAEFAAANHHHANSVGVCGTDIPDIVVRGLEDGSSLSREELAKFLFWLNGSMRMYQHQHHMFLTGNLSEETWVATENLMRGFVGTHGFRGYWNARRSTFTEPFQDCVDALDTGDFVSSAAVLDSVGISGGAER